MDVPGAKRRQKIYIACEEVNMIWSENEVSDFQKLWKEGRSIQQIAAHFKRDPDEIGLLVIDQARKGHIKTQSEPTGKGQSHKVIATVEKVKKETPTVISIHGTKGGLRVERLILHGKAPSVNHMYRNARVGRRQMKVLSPEARKWYDDTVIQANVWRNKNKWSTATGKVVVRLWFYFPDRRKRDTHNALKALLDALEDACIYQNDQYALPQVMDFEVDRKNPRIEIEFEHVAG